ncbi:hypothetical protein LguiA_022538 [Lonicera macranthoides]
MAASTLILTVPSEGLTQIKPPLSTTLTPPLTLTEACEPNHSVSKRFARRTTENSDRRFLFQTRWFRRCHTAQSVIAATWSTSIVDTMVRELHHWAKLEASNLQSPTTDMRQIFLAKGQSIKAWNESSGAE